MALLVALVAAPAASASGNRGLSSGPQAAGGGSGTGAVATRLEGIDVSHWQNTIDWSKVAAAGKSFAIIKATESTDYTDPLYATNHMRAKAAGLWTGAYHFAQPSLAANDAVLEADYFVSVINLGAHDLIPALDLEVSGGLGTVALQNWVMAWMGEVTARIGIRPMIYTSPNFWKVYMGDTTALADAGYKTLWIAHWGVTSPTVAANNWGGHGWTFWQYTSSGTVPGITGRVDLDRYNGADLAAQAYSIFSLAPSASSGTVKQGQSVAATVRILRTNFSSGIALDVSGLPAGTTAAFSANPATDASSAMTVTTPADPNATPVGTYPLTITGVANGQTRTTRVNLIVADGIPPTVTAPSTSLITGTLGTSSVPVRVAWTATDPSGVTGLGIQRSINGGTWHGLSLASAAVRAIIQSLPSNAAVTQRVRATDARMNTSAFATGPIVRNAVSQQAMRGIAYAGIWHSLASSSASGGSLRYSTARRASVTFRFSGASIAWVSSVGPGRGSAYVYLDGVYVKTVNLYSTVGRSRAIVFTRNWGAVGVHTITIVVAGTAGHPRVDLDAFVRLGLG